MIKTLTAYTEEIDDVELAVQEILEQLDIEGTLLKQTVGILSCHYEFVYSGVVKALSAALPFDVVGTITSTLAVNEGAGTLLLSLMVLTSDDTEFATGCTPSLHGDPGPKIAQTYRQTAAAREGKPALIFAFAPFMVENSGDEYVNVFTEVSGGAPCFGTLAVDDTNDFAHCYALFNGEHYRDRLMMILIYGDFSPRFFIASLSQDKVLAKAALVTKSSRHILMEVNDRPVVEYFEDLGLTKASETQYAMTSLPFMLDYGDGTPQISKVFIGLTPEKYAICAGDMPEGSTLYLGVFEKADVLLTTGEAVSRILEDSGEKSGLLIYSCIARSMALGAEQTAELELIREKTAAKLPLMMAYSGGEMCPTQVDEDKAINRFHNNAFIGCIF